LIFAGDVNHILTATHAHMKKIKAEGRVVALIHILCEIAVENHVEKWSLAEKMGLLLALLKN